MVSLTLIFWIFVVMFAIIGSMRGWAKEVLVIFSVILALAFISILENFVPYIKNVLAGSGVVKYWVRTVIVLLMAFFGYQSPRIGQIGKVVTRKDQIQEVLLGAILGAVSGYMIFGSLWSFMDQAGYPFSPIISKPVLSTPLGPAGMHLVNLLPPLWLGKMPNIIIAVVLAFIFVIVVFV
jgi:hypothetical protein